jgi:hypothetical protein
MNEIPLCVALVLCNEVIEDRRSGNKTLVGLFNNIGTANLPALHPRMFLFATLTGGIGLWPFTFRILSPSGAEVMRIEDKTDFQDPFIGHDLVIELRNLPLNEEGVYFVDLLVGETPLLHRRFTVKIVSES